MIKLAVSDHPFHLRHNGAVGTGFFTGRQLQVVISAGVPSAMYSLPSDEASIQLSNALQQMRLALSILDQVEARGDVGAILDLAIVRLEEWLGRCSPANVEAMIARLERELAASPSTPWNASLD